MKNLENKKIVGKKMGKKIEEIFELDKLKKGEKKHITMKEIRKAIPKYPQKNGHPHLRDGSKGGQQIGYLVYKYGIVKHNKYPNNKNSEIVGFDCEGK